MATLESLAKRGYPIALLLAAVLGVVAIVTEPRPLWYPASGQLLAVFALTLVGFRVALAWPVGVAVAALILLLLLAGAWAHTPAAMMAWLLTAGIAAGIGARLLPRASGQPAAVHLALCCALGLVVIAALMNVLIRVRINSGGLDALLLAVLAAPGARRLRDSGAWLCTELRHRSAPAARWPLALCLATAATMAIGGLWPVSGFDDVSYHLRYAVELLERGRFTADLGENIWQAAPAAGDMIHALASWLAAGDLEVRGPLATSYVLGSALLLYHALVGGLGTARAALMTALLLSTPFLFVQQMSLQTEALAVFWVSAAWIVVRTPELCARDQRWRALLLLAAGLIALKTAMIPLALLLIIWLAVETRATPAPERRWTFGVTVLAALLIAAYPYLEAWRLTGNPVFPLLNGVFKSPQFEPINFANDRYQGHFDAGLWWRMIFRGDLTYETLQPISGGVQYFVLLLPALLLLPWSVLPTTRRSFAVAALLLLAVFAGQQYFRYGVPVLPLLSAVLAAPLAERAGISLLAQRITIGLAVACLLANLVATASLAHQVRDDALGPAFDPERRADMQLGQVPEYLANRWISATDAQWPNVVYWGSARGANLAGQPLVNSWTSPRRHAEVERLASVDAVGAWVRATGVDYIVAPMVPENPVESWPMLTAYLTQRAQLLRGFGRVGVFQPPFEDRWSQVLVDLPRLDALPPEWGRKGALAFVDGGIDVTRGAEASRSVPVQGLRRLRLELTLQCPDGEEGSILMRVDFSGRKGYIGPRARAIDCSRERMPLVLEVVVPPRADTAFLILNADRAPRLRYSALRLLGTH